MRVPPSLRFVASVGAIVLVFGACGSLSVGALDRSQTQASGSLLDPAALFRHDLHFIQVGISVLTTARDVGRTPLRDYFLQGLGTTIEFCFFSMPLALLLGFLLALMSRSRVPLLRVPARAYVEFFRNTPLIVQLLAIYTSLLFLPKSFLNAFTAGVATLVLNYAAYECENLRGGLAAVDRGQGEAAAALGLSYWQSLRHVILPQMVTIVLPPVINDLIYMYKDSAILSLITVQELTVQASDLARRSPNRFWQFYLIDAGIYLLLSLPLGRVARQIEVRLKSATLMPRRDLTVAALQALGGMVAVSWICGVLVEGVSLGSVADNLGQFLAAVELTVAAVLFSIVVLGALVYIPRSLLRLLRRYIPRRHRARSAPAAVALPR